MRDQRVNQDHELPKTDVDHDHTAPEQHAVNALEKDMAVTSEDDGSDHTADDSMHQANHDTDHNATEKTAENMSKTPNTDDTLTEDNKAKKGDDLASKSLTGAIIHLGKKSINALRNQVKSVYDKKAQKGVKGKKAQAGGNHHANQEAQNNHSRYSDISSKGKQIKTGFVGSTLTQSKAIYQKHPKAVITGGVVLILGIFLMSVPSHQSQAVQQNSAAQTASSQTNSNPDIIQTEKDKAINSPFALKQDVNSIIQQVNSMNGKIQTNKIALMNVSQEIEKAVSGAKVSTQQSIDAQANSIEALKKQQLSLIDQINQLQSRLNDLTQQMGRTISIVEKNEANKGLASTKDLPFNVMGFSKIAAGGACQMTIKDDSGFHALVTGQSYAGWELMTVDCENNMGILTKHGMKVVVG